MHISKEEYTKFVNKIKILYDVNRYKIINNHKENECIIIKNNDGTLKLIIPDGVEGFSNDELCDAIHDCHSTLYVKGGKDIKEIKNMFTEAKIDIIDLTEFSPVALESLDSGFLHCVLGEIKFGNLDTSKVKDMQSMFFNAYIKKLEMSNFDTSRVTNMQDMFNSFKVIDALDLSSFNTSRLRVADDMFTHAHIYELDISSFTTESLTSWVDMFRYAHIGKVENNRRTYISNIKVNDARLKNIIKEALETENRLMRLNFNL